jgi:hypothetical protein
MIGAYNVISLFQWLPRITLLTAGKSASQKKDQYVLLWQNQANYIAGLMRKALIITAGQYMVTFFGGLTSSEALRPKVGASLSQRGFSPFETPKGIFSLLGV